MKIKALQAMSLLAVFSLGAASTASADVQLTMQNGRVSVVAKDATVRQILTEWARVGQTKIVNVERIPGGPMTIELHNVTESQALEILLRAMSGYIAAPRPVEAANATNLSRFDRIIVMPTLASARPAVSSTPPPVYQQPPQQQFMQQPQPADDDADDEPAPNVNVPQRGPVFNTFPQQQPQFPGQAPNQFQPTTVSPFNGQPFPVNSPNSPNQPPPGSQPAAPFGGVSVPGMVAPAPQPQPGQFPPGTFPPGQQQPTPPPRRP
jgi:hypothetical protein